MPIDIIKPVAVSIAQAARAWSVSRGTAYAILRDNPWIRVLAVHGTKRAIPFEDVEEYIRRCAVVGLSANSNKMRSVEAARVANRAKKAAKTARANKPPAAPAPIADSSPPLVADSPSKEAFGMPPSPSPTEPSHQSQHATTAETVA